ncbi:expressed protein [Phakopsora pachyrhizi]|uniref:Expressed protein n=1 Tax=Phakopsora pachyrhizi TaxID=170000 RepID=A0AAV0AQW4_PHAPC|nr:expressed protein [Phakopsora pachyrhizi]
MDYPIESRSPHRGTPLRVLKEEKYNIQESIPYRNSKNILFRRSLELKRPPIVHVKRNCNSLTLSNEDSEFVTKTSSLTSSLEDEPTFLGEMNKKFDCYNSAGENRRTLPSLEFGTDFSFQNILNGKLVENQDNSKSEDSESNYSFESDHGAEDFDSTLLGFREGIDSFPHAPNFRSSGLIEMFEENVRHAVEQERDFQDSSHELSSPVPGFNAPSQVYGTVEQSAAKRSPTSIASKTASTQKKTKLTKRSLLLLSREVRPLMIILEK